MKIPVFSLVIMLLGASSAIAQNTIPQVAPLVTTCTANTLGQVCRIVPKGGIPMGPQLGRCRENRAGNYYCDTNSL